jgi:hypothetical protein
MAEIGAALTTVAQAAEAVQTAETELHEKRERLRVALEEGQKAGASITLLARTAGLSRQRVAQISQASRNIR